MSDDVAPTEPQRAEEVTVSTGNMDVDAAIARLAELDGLPTGQHVAVFEDVHGRLQQTLAHVDGS